MVGLSGASALSGVALTKVNVSAPRKSAEIVRLPRVKLPRLDDYLDACALLIAATFPASSQSAICDRAARETRIASPDTFARIMAHGTHHADAYLIHCCMTISASRGVAIPAALAVRA